MALNSIARVSLFSKELIERNANRAVYVFGANEGHASGRTLGGGGQASATGGNRNVLGIITMEGSLSPQSLNLLHGEYKKILEDFVAEGGKVVFPVNTGGGVNIGTGIASGSKNAKSGQKTANDLMQHLQGVAVQNNDPAAAMQKFNARMDALELKLKPLLATGRPVNDSQFAQALEGFHKSAFSPTSNFKNAAAQIATANASGNSNKRDGFNPQLSLSPQGNKLMIKFGNSQKEIWDMEEFREKLMRGDIAVHYSDAKDVKNCLYISKNDFAKFDNVCKNVLNYKPAFENANDERRYLQAASEQHAPVAAKHEGAGQHNAPRRIHGDAKIHPALKPHSPWVANSSYDVYHGSEAARESFKNHTRQAGEQYPFTAQIAQSPSWNGHLRLNFGYDPNDPQMHQKAQHLAEELKANGIDARIPTNPNYQNCLYIKPEDFKKFNDFCQMGLNKKPPFEFKSDEKKYLHSIDQEQGRVV